MKQSNMMRLMDLSTGKATLIANGKSMPVYITEIECNSTGIVYGHSETTISGLMLDDSPFDEKKARAHTKGKMLCGPSIDKVIFSNPATIVFWTDGTKTVVKASSKDEYDPEKGFAMAIAKKAFGNQGNYYNVIKKFLPKDEETKK